MKKTKGTPQEANNIKGINLHLAFELNHKKWKLAFSDGEKKRTVNIEARDLKALQKEIRKEKIRFGQ